MSSQHIMVVAHRGVHALYPENSLAAVKEAITEGIDMVEIDVRVTKDDVLVLLHDADIKRVTGHAAKVSELTYEELQQYPLLNSRETIPTFEALLLLAKGKIMVDVDIKDLNEDNIKRVVEMIGSCEMETQVLLFLSDHRYAPMVYTRYPLIPLMPRAHNVTEMEEIMGMGVPFPVIHIDPSFYSDTLMEKVNRQSRIWMNALGRYDALGTDGFELLRMEAPFVNVIQTDHPALLLQWLRENNLHK